MAGTPFGAASASGGSRRGNKKSRDDEGDQMAWNDEHTALVCKLFAKQVRKGNRPNTHLNNVGYTEVNERFFQCTGIMLKKTQLKNKWDKLKADLGAWRKLMRKQTGTGWNWDKGTINMDAEWWKKQKMPLQNEDEMNVMFGSIINEEIDHWNPMSSNPIIPPSGDAPLILAWTTMMKKMIWVLEVSPTPGNAKRKAHIILEKPNKKPKFTTTLVIQEHIYKISESAQSFVSSRQAGITIEQVMEHVIACGADLGSDEHFVASELFVKKEQREMFMTIPTNEARFNWLKRKYDMIFGK
ncbi:hypothetical protein PVAP13_1KG199325 [Panicum virgatum]|uniref:Myb/SANT-like domain-containing protein n=1 Tax=Panicum virgatum TaxID=38727 RepID=A0A8T0XC73_PANVG|nr:hypothetical protein PVAP13_J523701 [Panicum virgatum]KAG2657670.1 hypothetical protein PVAP13_1KG199325 [Panicum virgatum]